MLTSSLCEVGTAQPHPKFCPECLITSNGTDTALRERSRREKMCAAACTVNPAGTRSGSGSVPVGTGGVKERGKSRAQWIVGREKSEGGNPRVRPRDAVLHAEECTPTKRIGGLSGDGNENKHVNTKNHRASGGNE